MSYDDNIKNIETPAAGTSGNIIHVNFCGNRRKLPSGKLSGQASAISTLGRRSGLTLSTPWLIRIAAMVSILILSLLVL